MEKLTQMQVDEILSEADAQRVTQPYLRRGQAFFNIMYERYPELADSVRATEYDPFHVDDKLYPCIAYLTSIEEDVNPILADIDDIVDIGMSDFWDAVNKIIFDDYTHCTDAQRDEAYEKVSEALKKSL